MNANRVAGQAAAPPHDIPTVTYAIAGTVVNSVTGAPLADAHISLVDVATRKNVAKLITAEGGHFEFLGLPTGKFSLDGAKRGYISASYEQHEQFSTAIVTGPEWKTDELVLRLNPTAMISGHVRDEKGEPVRHAEVTLFLENHGGGMNRVSRLFVATSDDLGYFDFSGLMPGKYFLSVSATPWYAVNGASAQLSNNGSGAGVSPALDVAYPVTYYSSATEAADATPIVVAAGERPEVELQLNPVAALHILVRAKEERTNWIPATAVTEAGI